MNKLETPVGARAVAFDLGETLVTYEGTPLSWTPLYRPALSDVATALGFVPTEEQFNTTETALLRYNTRVHPREREFPARHLFSDVLAGWGVYSEVAYDKVISNFFRFFQQRLRLYEDTLPALRTLRELSIPVGVLTDVPYGMPREFVENDLSAAGIHDFINVLLTSVEVGWRKPRPEGFMRLAEALSVSPAQLVYVGNEPKDIAGATAAGMYSVLIDRDAIAPDLGQAATISSLTRLFEVLDW